ncbi:MAG: hypothetical protein LBK82_08530 [Planctomycetaceae bacterium]|jgi:hypothetical protein|nr:hypothetical protein [Planctomycetaceae bacterium]
MSISPVAKLGIGKSDESSFAPYNGRFFKNCWKFRRIEFSDFKDFYGGITDEK